jgi:hypothetical protein
VHAGSLIDWRLPHTPTVRRRTCASPSFVTRAEQPHGDRTPRARGGSIEARARFARRQQALASPMSQRNSCADAGTSTSRLTSSRRWCILPEASVASLSIAFRPTGTFAGARAVAQPCGSGGCSVEPRARSTHRHSASAAGHDAWAYSPLREGCPDGPRGSYDALGHELTTQSFEVDRFGGSPCADCSCPSELPTNVRYSQRPVCGSRGEILAGRGHGDGDGSAIAAPVNSSLRGPGPVAPRRQSVVRRWLLPDAGVSFRCSRAMRNIHVGDRRLRGSVASASMSEGLFAPFMCQGPAVNWRFGWRCPQSMA